MIANILSVVALIAATTLAFATLRAERRGIEVSTYQRATELFLKLSDVMLTYPEIRPYFYENRPEDLARDEDERSRILIAAELHLDIFDWIGHECEGASEADRASWFTFMRAIFESSAVLWDFHEAHPEWHPVLDELLFQGSDGLRRPNEL